MHSALLVVAAASVLVHGKTTADPCTVATASEWVSSKVAHACELNVPFDKNRSLSVIDSNIKALPWYSLETWFIHSPNPEIPHDVNIASLLSAVQKKTAGSGYKTDWDFNMAVTDAWNREADGHSLYAADCTESFSWNLPFSIATLASSPTSPVAYPTFLVNYDFPNQGRSGIEAYFESIGVKVRPYDGARILSINGVEAGTYLTKLATESSIYNGLVGAYETVNPRYMRLMSRYSADTTSGDFTQEVGRFGQRAFYPGADSVRVVLQTTTGLKTLTIPWAATFVGSGNTTESFIAETCLPASASPSSKRAERRGDRIPAHVTRQKGVVRPENQKPVRESSVGQARLASAATNYVQPNLTSFGHVTTLDLFQLAEHPKVGVMYFEQFEPSDGTDFNTYINGISSVLYDGLTQLKAAGVKHVLIDNSGNRGGYIFAGAVALWSLFPKDLYPGFPAVFRDTDITRRESVNAAETQDFNSEYYYGFYRDLEYNLLTNNSQFMDPPVAQKVNGVADAYSQHFFDDFGSVSDITNFTSPAFEGIDYVFVANSICASTCSVFSSYLFQKHGVRSAVFGGTPTAKTSQFDGGVKGSEVTDFSSVLGELQLAGLQDDPKAPQPFPVSADLTMNFRNAIPYVDKEDGILEYVWEQGTKKYQFTKELFNKPQAIWEFVAEEFFGQE
ncbi:hypothetical protein FB45DRAFT_1063530 [Roridomyces roridus]|uniref:Tail specific protease domain-containing protein n=1 Tax=Roridomyces roridus TaxID=1738132 RepID=A0AAD7BDG6_9AGAR|nr:hypothetical protein FB45DRAFT_1063530 [Roridomyces roridus]